MEYWTDNAKDVHLRVFDRTVCGQYSNYASGMTLPSMPQNCMPCVMCRERIEHLMDLMDQRYHSRNDTSDFFVWGTR